MSRFLIACLNPERRDALEETARLALNFITVAAGPGYSELKASRDVKVHLSPVALRQGCHLPDMAQELLEAVQAHGVEILKVSEPTADIAPEWCEWWEELPLVSEDEFKTVLEIR